MQVEWDSIWVNVVMKGKGGRNCLLLHGWMCSAQMMSSIQNALAPHMRTVAIDFPGCGAEGKAPAPKRTWSIDDYMRLTYEMIVELKLAPCDIIAHSFGARVAILLAATYPECVGRMVLTGAAGIRKAEDKKSKSRSSLYRFAKNAVSLMEDIPIIKDKGEKLHEALIQRFGSEDYKALDPQMRTTFNAIVTRDLTPYLEHIQAPTLLFWGANDTETPLWMGKKMDELIPDSGLIIEEGAGHFAYLERAVLFERVVKNFLVEGRS